MNVFNKLLKYALPTLTLILLLFIPLYPKLPLVDIQNTWVYIRVEDFIVLFAIAVWVYLLIKKKVTLNTPLTIPILAFWTMGAIATIHGVVIIFPTIAQVFPNVALLAYLRHIEYLSLFFVAYSAVKNKQFVFASIVTVLVTLLLVVAYGFGQKFLSFPAYLTMNEEYAKGIPIIISPLNRISSTFAGHYDLAAYLVLIIPIAVSLIFGVRNYILKILLALTATLGVILLLMTVSRVSFFVLFIALFAVVFFQKRKLIYFFIPLVAVAGAFFMLTQSSLLSRFGSTVKEVDVLVDTKSGGAIGHVKLEERSYLSNKLILINEDAKATISGNLTPTPIFYDPTVPRVLQKYRIPLQIGIVQAKITSTGETLPQGSSYINLSLSPVIRRMNSFFYEYPPNIATSAAQIQIVTGDFLVKRASAYDLSFTTRFQGEWPNALLAFGRNIFFGSGYGSVSLAVDNNYFRMLGETGLLGTVSFIVIFIILGVYIRKTLPLVESKVIRSFVIGFVAGVIGLSLNAILIDVFEASKVAFVLWLLTGIVVGALSLYRTRHFNIYKELLKTATSPIAICIYLFVSTLVIFSTTLSGYFIGDDFTWFRWASDCKAGGESCKSLPGTITSYFFNSEGFFYRPGTKIYFLLMFPLFWLNQVIYHAVSILLHFIVVLLLYFLARKIFKNDLLAAASSFIFLISSGYLEIVLWISSTGHLFNAIFILLSLLTFIKWDESKRVIFIILSVLFAIISLTFYEIGIITPFLAIAYKLSKVDFKVKDWVEVFKDRIIILLFIPNLLYFVVRYFSHTHWFSGDYSYNLLKLPFNAIGNAFGYILVSLFGPLSLPLYEKLRLIIKDNIPLAIILFILVILVGYISIRYVIKKLDPYSKRIIIFAFLFFMVCLIPYLGLGNITYRYSYLASFGVVMIFVFSMSRFYLSLRTYGRDVALWVTATVLSIFCLFHIVQAQQTIIDWRGAGARVERFLTSLNSLYQDSWSKNNVDLYFANVLTKNNTAWIFPVGLSDAVWFAFQNDNITVHQIPDFKSAPMDAYKSRTKGVFEFQPDGSLREIRLNKNIYERLP